MATVINKRMYSKKWANRTVIRKELSTLPTTREYTRQKKAAKMVRRLKSSTLALSLEPTLKCLTFAAVLKRCKIEDTALNNKLIQKAPNKLPNHFYKRQVSEKLQSKRLLSKFKLNQKTSMFRNLRETKVNTKRVKIAKTVAVVTLL